MPKVVEKLSLKRKGLYIFKQDNSPNWQVRITIGKHKPYQSTTGTDSPEEAKLIAIEKYVKFKSDIESGVFRSSVSFRQIASEVIEDINLDKKRSGKSSKSYVSIINKFTDNFFKDMSIDIVDEGVINQYYKWRGSFYGELKKSTVLKHNIALRMIFNKCISKNIAIKVRIDKFKNDGVEGDIRKPITYDHYRMLEDYLEDKIEEHKGTYLGDQYKVLLTAICLLLSTGARPGKEIHSILWKDITINIDNGNIDINLHIREAKTKARDVEVVYHFLFLIEDFANMHPNRKADDHFLSLDNGAELPNDFLSREFAKVMQELGIKEKGDNEYTLYSCRHAYLTWHSNNETDIISTAMQCGTSPGMIFKFYVHKSKEIQKRNFGGLKRDKVEFNRFILEEEFSEKDKKWISKHYGHFSDNCKKRGFP